MKCYIYLFRHGGTHFNKSKRFTGWVDSGLTKKGMKCSRIVARKLKKKRIDVAFYTRLRRSKDTLKEVLRFHPECLKLVKEDRMIERSYGRLQRKYHKTIIKKYGKERFDIWHRSYDVPPPGGESIKMVEKRVKSFIRDLLRFIGKYKVNVAISAHGNSMRPFRRYFEKLTIKEMMKLENPYDDYFEYCVEC